MYRVIQTTIGRGNGFDDLSFLWFSDGYSIPGPSPDPYLEQFAASVGLSQLEILDATDAQGVQARFIHRLIADPRPCAGDALRWIVELSASLSDFNSRKTFVSEFTNWITRDRSPSLAEWQRQNEDDYKTTDSEVLTSNVATAFLTPTVVVEQSPPSLASITTLLTKGSGVAIGSLLGLHLAQGYSPIFLCVAVPGGMLIGGTAAGIAEALQLGLRQRVLAWVLGVSERQRRTSAARALESLFPDTYKAAGTAVRDKPRDRERGD
jgi:hypothetical protein